MIIESLGIQMVTYLGNLLDTDSGNNYDFCDDELFYQLHKFNLFVFHFFLLFTFIIISFIMTVVFIMLTEIGRAHV